MDKRNRLSVSFRNEFQHVYDYLQTVPNKSQVIGEAVEAYMNTDHSPIAHDDIKKIVMEILQTQGNLTSMHIQHVTPSENQITSDDAELISQLF